MLPENLTVKELIYLLAVKNATGKATLKHEHYYYGIIGGVLLELTSLERVEIQNKKLVVRNAKPTGDKALDFVFSKIRKRRKPRKIKNWVSAFTNHFKKIRDPIREALIQKRYLVREEKKFLGIIPYTNYPITKQEEKQKILEYLHNTILHKDSYPEKEGTLISMLYLSGVFQTIFPERKERKQAKKKIKKQIKEGLISSAVGESIKEMQAAMIAAVTAATVATAAGSSSN